MAKKRSALSKSARFEVLKRDKFTCQYCGAAAPHVLLHVDHISPVVDGGLNDILNLITACEACNLGKGPRKLSDDSAISKTRDQLAELQARKEQIEMMAAWQHGLVDLQEDAVNEAQTYYKRLAPGWSLNEIGLGEIRAAIAKHGLQSVLAAMRSAAAQSIRVEDGKATQDSVRIMCRRFFNELKYKGYRDTDPVGSELRYIRGIMRNRFTYFSMAQQSEALRVMQEHVELGGSVKDLKQLAFDCTYYTQWLGGIADLNDSLSGASSK